MDVSNNDIAFGNIKFQATILFHSGPTSAGGLRCFITPGNFHINREELDIWKHFQQKKETSSKEKERFNCTLCIGKWEIRNRLIKTEKIEIEGQKTKSVSVVEYLMTSTKIQLYWKIINNYCGKERNKILMNQNLVGERRKCREVYRSRCTSSFEWMDAHRVGKSLRFVQVHGLSSSDGY